MASDRYLGITQASSPAAVREMGLGPGASKRLKV